MLVSQCIIIGAAKLRGAFRGRGSGAAPNPRLAMPMRLQPASPHIPLPGPTRAGDLNETFVVGEVDEASKQLVKVTYEVRRWRRGGLARRFGQRWRPTCQADHLVACWMDIHQPAGQPIHLLTCLPKAALPGQRMLPSARCAVLELATEPAEFAPLLPHTACSCTSCTPCRAVPAQGDCDLQAGHAVPRDWGGDHQARQGARVRPMMGQLVLGHLGHHGCKLR